MIISHKYKFIFLKTNKTAGTSIEIALSKFCGPDDVITPISHDDEKTRGGLGYLGPQNYLFPNSDYGIWNKMKVILKKNKPAFYNHITAKEIKALIGEQVWDSYYKFCFERNPWDRIISGYYWKNQSEPRPSISEFLKSKYPLRLKRRGIDLYTINGQIAVNRVCRFENLNKEMEAIRKQLGIPEELVLPRAKSRFRKDRRSYRDILNEEEKVKIAKLFSDEIKLFDYKF
jgi:Sulfotransferase family